MQIVTKPKKEKRTVITHCPKCGAEVKVTRKFKLDRDNEVRGYCPLCVIEYSTSVYVPRAKEEGGILNESESRVF
jgi:ribosomal protein S14